MSDVLIARIDSFTPGGRYVYRGQTATREEVEVDGKVGDNFIEAPEGVNANAVVEVSAIAPTGPNPANPQQIAPDVVQTEAGYVQSGARLVGEVTKPEKERIEIVGIDSEDDTQAQVTQALEDADRETGDQNADGVADDDESGQNDDDDLVAGTVKDVVAGITPETSEADLDRLYAAEKDREKPRTGVLSAIDAERERRQNS
jgi:hypothetical protein